MRHRKLRQAGRNVSHRFHTNGGEVEEQHGSSGEHHADQGGRKLRHETRDNGDDGECSDGDGKSRSVDVTELSKDLCDARDDAGLDHREAEDLVGLTENDRERDTIEEADKDRSRQEVRKAAQSQKACRNAEQSGEQSKHHRKRGVSCLIAGRERSHARRNQRTGGGVRPDDQLAGGAENRIGHEWQNTRIEPHLRAEAGKSGIGDADRKRHRGNRKTCPQVGGGVGEFVVEQPGKARGVAGKGRHRPALSDGSALWKTREFRATITLGQAHSRW